jgi:tetratricopeptide (TPR) repeat protein
MLKPIKDIEKKIFYTLAGILFILLPILSLNSGISGDEATFHYPHGINSYNYYATLGKDTTCLYYNNSPNYMYGPVFDVITVAAVKIFKPDDEYMLRHVLNSMTGWAAIFFASLISVMLGGWRAGIITLIFMFLSPNFIGHSYNNPKDIPFTAAYIFTIYAIIRFLKKFPEKKFKYGWPIALGIGLAIGVRVGGVLLAFYFLFFAGIYYLFTLNYKVWFKQENLLKLTTLLFWSIVIAVAGYFIGILLWPFAQKAPIKHTLEALNFMSNDTSSIMQTFEGKATWSDKLPFYYLPKYILMTIPEYVILGVVIFILLINRTKWQNSIWYFVLLFTSIFPVLYIIYKGSNVYGGWRHVIFVYPGIAIFASLGTNTLIDLFKQKYFQIVITGIFGLLVLLPLVHIIKNHPHEYIYYNSISGGVKKAYGKYEMDYYYHSLRAGSEWLIKNKIDNKVVPKDKKIIVATNHEKILQYYFRKYTDKVKVIYIRYYDRGNSDWDYAIIANSYINPFQLKKKIWPPSNTIHTVDVDKKPICAILERTDKNDFEGYSLMMQKKFPQAIEHFKAAVERDKNYENVYTNLAESYLNIGQYDNAILAATSCLKLYPNNKWALNTVGLAYMNKQKYENALEVFMQNMKENPRNVLPFYYTGLIYAQTNDFETALKYLRKALDVDGRYKPTYYLIARIHEIQGNTQLAKKFKDYANTLP